MPIRDKKNKKVTPEKTAAIINELAYTEKTYQQIADEYEVSPSFVYYTNKKYDHPGSDPLEGTDELPS